MQTTVLDSGFVIFPGTIDSMKEALKGFFSPRPDGQGSIVAWANRRMEPENTVADSDQGQATKSKEIEAFLEPVNEFVARGSIVPLDLSPRLQAVSSTDVRRKVREESEKGSDGLVEMIPEAILDYIRANHLYLN